MLTKHAGRSMFRNITLHPFMLNYAQKKISGPRTEKKVIEASACQLSSQYPASAIKMAIMFLFSPYAH